MRDVRVVKADSALGKKLVDIGGHWEGRYLSDIYHKYSDAKKEAWNRCYTEYCCTEGANCFCICAHNTFHFTCSWFLADGSMRLETRDNSYLVMFDDAK